MELPLLKRVFLIVLDSLGIGALPDAEDYGDAGSHTLRTLALSGKLRIPMLTKMGIFNIENFCLIRKIILWMMITITIY